MNAKKELTHPLTRATLVFILDTREVAMIRSGTINTIYELSTQGKSIREIARMVGIARNTVRRVIEHHESLRQVAAEYGVSHETIRRILRTSRHHRAG